jgi:HD superfamily hydrolase
MEMIAYDKGDPKRIHHFLKVHDFARLIGVAEGLEEKTLFRLEAAAYVHDIGIHEGERRFGRNDGKIQEDLGPAEAEAMLERLGFEAEDIRRISWLVGHHHSYGSIDGPDAQILAEADMLVNQYEDGADRKRNEALYHRLYKTETGKRLFEALYFEEYAPHA